MARWHHGASSTSPLVLTDARGTGEPAGRVVEAARNPTTSPGRHREIPRWPKLEAVVGAVIGSIALIPIANSSNPALPFDDAYISFAYALRLTAGQGLRLNPGVPPVEAFSDPLWVFALAIGRGLGVTIPTWAVIVNIVLVAALAGTTMRLVRRLNPSAPVGIGIGAAIAIALIPAVAYYVVGGLETLLFAVLFNAVLLSFLRDRERRRPLSPATSVLCLLLALTRPEGVLVWGSAWAVSWAWSRDLRGQTVAAARFVLPGVVLEIGRLLYFQQLLPNSIVAKSGQPLSTSLQLAQAEFHRFWHQYYLVILVGLAVVVACLVIRDVLPRFRPLAVVVLVTACFEVATSSGDSYPYERYLFFVLPPVLAAAVAGLSRIGWGGTGWARGHGIAHARPLTGALVAVFLGVSLVIAYVNREAFTTAVPVDNVARGVSQIPNLFRPDRLQDHSGAYHYALAGLLRTQPAGSVIAMDEIGTVSYYTEMKVLDLYGLANTHISNLPGAPGTRAAPNYVFSRHPRDFVFLTGTQLSSLQRGDAAYANDPRMFGYQLAYLLYNSYGFRGLLFEKDVAVARVVSLDGLIPAGQRQTMTMPPVLAYLLAVQVPHVDAAALRLPPPEIRRANVLAVRSAFTAITAGSTVSLTVGRLPGRDCTMHVTGLSAGAALLPAGAPSPQALTLAVTSPQPQGSSDSETMTLDLPARALSLPAQTIDQAELPVPSSLPVTVTLSGSSGAQWTEPYITCRYR